MSGRVTRGMDRFTITRSVDNVAVDVYAMHKEDKAAAGWAAAMLKV